MKRLVIARLIISSLLVFFTLISSFSQVTEAEKRLRELSSDTITGWKSGGVAAINLSQTSLTNWAAGGQSSLAVNGIFSGYANLLKGKSIWNNTLDIGYGIVMPKQTTKLNSFQNTGWKHSRTFIILLS